MMYSPFGLVVELLVTSIIYLMPTDDRGQNKVNNTPEHGSEMRLKDFKTTQAVAVHVGDGLHGNPDTRMSLKRPTYRSTTEIFVMILKCPWSEDMQVFICW